ncbi:MAG: hypothetical protein JOZ77_03270 [Candidatus Eremiobacteraeota bacterium]|nr:hypothetical protein [Candidatus Eremiobacteraeota bacterium]
MRFLPAVSSVVATTVALAVLGSAAVAHGIVPTFIMDGRVSYSGSWPVTISKAPRGNGTYCLTLKETGRNAGSASLTGNGSNQPFGTFFIINHILIATIQQEGGSQNAGLLFIAPANNGNVGSGVFEQVYGGENSDSGRLVFGTKGGC